MPYTCLDPLGFRHAVVSLFKLLTPNPTIRKPNSKPSHRGILIADAFHKGKHGTSPIQDCTTVTISELAGVPFFSLSSPFVLLEGRRNKHNHNGCRRPFNRNGVLVHTMLAHIRLSGNDVKHLCMDYLEMMLSSIHAYTSRSP